MFWLLFYRESNVSENARSNLEDLCGAVMAVGGSEKARARLLVGLEYGIPGADKWRWEWFIALMIGEWWFWSEIPSIGCGAVEVEESNHKSIELYHASTYYVAS